MAATILHLTFDELNQRPLAEMTIPAEVDLLEIMTHLIHSKHPSSNLFVNIGAAQAKASELLKQRQSRQPLF